VVPSRERKLDEIKERVETQWRDEQTSQRLEVKAKEMVDKLNGGTALAELAAQEKLKVEAASALKRGKASEALPAPLIEEVFRTPPEKASSARGQSETERIVFRVTDAKAEPLKPDSPEAKRINDTLQRAYADDILSQYVAQLQNDLGVTINEAALLQIVGGQTN
jgi:peptidyl-prolyl cis-trans isomerase D